jgi:hypothetical protein
MPVHTRFLTEIAEKSMKRLEGETSSFNICNILCGSRDRNDLPFQSEEYSFRQRGQRQSLYSRVILRKSF